MPCAIERGTDEIVHRRVADHEIARRAGLDVLDAREKQTGISDQRAAGIEYHLLPALAHRAQRARDEGPDRLLCLVAVPDGDSAAEVDVTQTEARALETADHRDQPAGGG